MKRVYRVLFFISLLTGVLQAVEKRKISSHTIGNGETLFTVAKLYHTTSREIQAENNLSKDEMLHIGQVIKVPMNTYFPKKEKKIRLEKGERSKYSNAKLILHSIKTGESLFTIARKYHSTMDEILIENNITAKTRLNLGQVLIVPQNTYDKKTKTVISHFVKHSIQKNETLFTIAQKYHSTIKDIEKKNKLKKAEVLKLGRILIVPKNSYGSPKIIKKLKKVIVKAKIKVKKKKIKVVKKVKKKKIKIAKKTVKTKKKISKIKIKKKPKVLKKIVQKKHIPLKKVPRSKIITLAKTKLGRRYVWGASGARNTYDCSSFTKHIYKRTGINLPRTSLKQSRFGEQVSKEKLKKGDLLFFDTSRRRKGYVNHVGIYMGDGKFIHASSAKKKVVISKLEKFYLERYRGARRPL